MKVYVILAWDNISGDVEIYDVYKSKKDAETAKLHLLNLWDGVDITEKILK